MKHLIEMFRESKVNQILDWTLFQKYTRNAYLISNPTNSPKTEVYLKFDGVVTRYTFDVQGVLTSVSNETPA